MNEWIIYAKKGCKFCIKAKELLHEYHIPFTVIDVNDANKDSIYKQIDELTNKYRYFPIIFYKKQFIGGYKELQEFINTNIKQCKINQYLS